MYRAKLRILWPHLRVVLIAFHAVAVVVLSAPEPHLLTDPSMWENKTNRKRFADWSQRLSILGYDSADELKEDLWALSQIYLAIRQAVSMPFERYAQWFGVKQGWLMFSGTRQEPAELHLDIYEGGAWHPLIRPHSDEHDFFSEKLTNNRFRKVLGRQSNRKTYHGYDQLARFLAVQAIKHYPEATQVRVRLYRYPTRKPADVRAQSPVRGAYENELIFPAEKLK